jgi:hypothetical protein
MEISPSWRSQFDEYAGNSEEMSFSQFQKLVKSKYEDIIPEKEIPTKVVI